MKRVSHKAIAAFAAVCVVAGVGVSVASAATTTRTNSVLASTIKPVAKTVIANDDKASTKKAFEFTGATSVSTTLSAPAGNAELKITARATQCNGAPQLAASVDGKQVILTSVWSSGYYSAYTATGIGAGKHTITIGMPKDLYQKNVCDGNLFVDQILLSANVASTTPAASGFTVKGTKIYGPDGKVFTPKGANMMGERGFFKNQNTTSMLPAAQAWNFNTIRLNSCINPNGCFNYVNWKGDETNKFDDIVKAYTAKKIVVMIASHDVKSGQFPTNDQLAILKTQWKALATKYKDNPYVWFNTMNEPGNGKNYATVNQTWVDTQSALIKTIRDTGAKNVVVVDGSQYGQDNDGWVQSDTVPAYSSAIISRGADLTKSYANLLFSVHVYDSYGYGKTITQDKNRLKSYIAQVQAKNLALVIGETGMDPIGGSDGQSWHSNPPGSIAVDVAPSLGVGILAWHGQSQDHFQLVKTSSGTSSINMINSTTNPTNLTPWGQKFWSYTH